jgi:hypothetical protein
LPHRSMFGGSNVHNVCTTKTNCRCIFSSHSVDDRKALNIRLRIIVVCIRKDIITLRRSIRWNSLCSIGASLNQRRFWC